MDRLLFKEEGFVVHGEEMISLERLKLPLHALGSPSKAFSYS
jgi:hypothetical protein